MTRSKQNPILVTILALGMPMAGLLAATWIPTLAIETAHTTLIAASSTSTSYVFTPPTATAPPDPFPTGSIPTGTTRPLFLPSTTSTVLTTRTTRPTVPPPVTTVPIVLLAQAEQTLIADANAIRASIGLAAVIPDPVLTAYARNWAQHLADVGDLSHSNISTLLDGWVVIGENVAAGTEASEIADDIAASPPHLSIITEAAYTEIGVGVVVDGNGELWVVQVFAGETLPVVTTTTLPITTTTLPITTTTIEITTTTIEIPIETTVPTLPNIPVETTAPESPL